MNHKATCPRRNYEEIIAAKLEEREGSQAVGLDEDDYLCNCQPGPAASEATAQDKLRRIDELVPYENECPQWGRDDWRYMAKRINEILYEPPAATALDVELEDFQRSLFLSSTIPHYWRNGVERLLEIIAELRKAKP